MRKEREVHLYADTSKNLLSRATVVSLFALYIPSVFPQDEKTEPYYLLFRVLRQEQEQLPSVSETDIAS